MRIGGLASGMDTEQMVKDLMKAERIRVDKLMQNEQRIRWRQEAYHDVNRNMANFILNSRKAFSGNQGAITRGTVQRFDWVKSANSSNEGIVRTTASANAMSGTHTVKVKELAQVASVTSKNLKDADNLLEDDGVTFKDLGISRELTIKTKAPGDEDEEFKEFNITIGDGEGEVKTINDLVRTVNNATVTEGGKEINLGLRAAYDSSLGRLMITTRETGENQTIKITGDFADDLFSQDNIDEEIKGTDAKIVFNGQEIKKSTNNFSVFGIDLQLQSVDEDTEVTIRVDADVDGIYNKVEEFISSYNEMIDEINELVGQKYYRDFPPLTDEQKAAMSDDEVEMWEEKAKSGLLRRDDGLNRVLQTMRTGIYNEVQGTIGQFNHITNIGITTGNYQDGGKLVIDEDKLRAAIANDPEGVVDLLFKTSDTTVPTNGTSEEIRDARQQRASETGIIQRIYDDMITGMKDIIRRSGHGEDASLFRTVQSNMLIDFVTSSGSISVIDRDLTNINTRIAREEQLLASREDRYWRQFSAMERAMNEMHQQSDWLMSQMGMGQ